MNFKVANESHLMGGLNQVKNCHHLKPFGIVDFYPPCSSSKLDNRSI